MSLPLMTISEIAEWY